MILLIVNDFQGTIKYSFLDPLKLLQDLLIYSIYTIVFSPTVEQWLCVKRHTAREKQATKARLLLLLQMLELFWESEW